MADAVRTAISLGLEESVREAGLSIEGLAVRAEAEASAILALIERQAERLREAERVLDELLERRASRFSMPISLRVGGLGMSVVVAFVTARSFWPLSPLEWIVAGYLAFGGLGIFLGFPFRSVGSEGRERDDVEIVVAEERLSATREAFKAALVREAASGWLRQQINSARSTATSRELHFEDASGLAELQGVEGSPVATDGIRRIRELLTLMPGGTIGVSGSRGVGKTTLIRTLCEDAESGKQDDLKVVVEAPVQYDGREFALHIFGRVCEAVLGTQAVEDLRDRHSATTAWGPGVLLRPPMLFAAVGFVLALLGVVFIVSANGTAPSSRFIGVVIGGLGGLMTVAAVLTAQRESAERRRRHQLISGGSPARGQRATAARHLREIWFQQSFSSGWSGSLSLPLGLEGGVEAGWELAQHQLSFPDVVARLRDFLEVVAPRRRVLIGIDELDKMEDETARKFLNEAKAVFGVKGCYFLVSVSEDAMADFERRGLPFRDVFDSSFDEIVTLDHFSFENSKQLLAVRIIGLPLSFVALAHVFSAGLPRDLVRVSRAVIALPQGTDLTDAACLLGAELLAQKARAIEHRLGQIEDGEEKSEFVEWVRHPWSADSGSAGLREWYGQSPHHLGRSRTPEAQERSAAHTLILELALLSYFTLTVIETFDRLGSEGGLQTALTQSDSPVERLAAARQAFSTSQEVAWSMIAELRKAMEFPAVVRPH